MTIQLVRRGVPVAAPVVRVAPAVAAVRVAARLHAAHAELDRQGWR